MKTILFALIFLPLTSFAMNELSKDGSLGYVIAFAKSETLKAKAHIVMQKFESNKKNIPYFQSVSSMQKLLDPIKTALEVDINTIIVSNNNSPESKIVTLDQLTAQCSDEIINNFNTNFDKIITEFDSIQKIASRSCIIL